MVACVSGTPGTLANTAVKFKYQFSFHTVVVHSGDVIAMHVVVMSSLCM